MAMLEATGLVKYYGKRCVVNKVSFEVHPGEIVGLLGPNGAGKTTSFRMTCGMIGPNAGTVVLNGKTVTNWPMYRRAREGGMGYLAQESSVFRKLTVEQNLLGMMEMLGFDRLRRQKRCEELLDEFKIEKLRKSLAQSLSGGERQRLEIARCLVSEPRIILLDEPFTGIDPVTVASIQGIVRRLRQTGIAILITDHHVHETLQITDRSYVIRNGEVLCHGTPEEVRRIEAREFTSAISSCAARPEKSGPRSGRSSGRVRHRAATMRKTTTTPLETDSITARGGDFAVFPAISRLCSDRRGPDRRGSAPASVHAPRKSPGKRRRRGGSPAWRRCCRGSRRQRPGFRDGGRFYP